MLNPRLDKNVGTLDGQITRYTNRLIEILDNFILVDLWRFKYPSLKKYAWAPSTPLIQCRLDYLFISEFLTESAPSILVKGTFQGSLYKKRGRGFWKFNASLLEDIEFVTKVEEILKEGKIELNEVEDKSLIWDTIKAKIRGFCLKFSILRNREKNRKEKKLSTLIRKMETKPKLSEEGQQKKAEAEEELRKINEKNVQGMTIRALSRQTKIKQTQKRVKRTRTSTKRQSTLGRQPVQVAGRVKKL